MHQGICVCLEMGRYNPTVEFNQKAITKQFEPDITTGAYGNSNFKVEFIGAASELYLTTKDEVYYLFETSYNDNVMTQPSWNQVRALVQYSLLRFYKTLTPIVQKYLVDIKINLLGWQMH